MGAAKELRIGGHAASGKQSCSTMTTGRHSPRPHRAGVGLTLSTANSLDPGSIVLSISHPVVQDNWRGCGDVHDHNCVLLGSLVFAGELRDHQHINWLPITKSTCVVIVWRVLLSKDIAGYVLWYL